MLTKVLSQLHCDKVVLMEDERKTLKRIKNIFIKEGFTVYVAKNTEEVLKIAEEKKPMNYILDINMGEHREHEGLNALERLKKINDSTFVGILSAYPSRYKTMAQTLQADYFKEKTANSESDTLVLLYEMFIHMAKLTKEKMKNTEEIYVDCDINDEGIIDNSLEKSDINYVAFKALLADGEWRQKHIGNYVAFVNGQLVGESKDRLKLLAEIRSKYQNQPRFFTQVEEDERVVEISSPLSIE